MRKDARIATLLVGVVLACGSEPEPPGVASAPPAGQAETPEPAHTPEPAALPLLTGEFRISVDGDRIRLEAAEAERGLILAQLQDELGFELVSEEPLAPLWLSLKLEDQTLEAVLEQLLPGLQFRVEYLYDAERGGHRPGRVLVGAARVEEESEVAAAPPADQASAQRPRRFPKRDRPTLSEEERTQLRAEFEARDAAARAALDDESPEVRADAISDVDIEGPGRDRIFALAEEDPDSRVRAEAVKLLGEEESMAARDALYRALQDPASEVVMEALDWIEAVGDSSSIPYVQQAAEQNPDPRVQARAMAVANFLED